MENEIKVGEYIRTKLGDIKQITEGFEFIIERHNKSSNNIVKHSPNLIDLIECGDYVNGEKVRIVAGSYVQTNVSEIIEMYEGRQYLNMHTYTENEIKSVVTKEMMEQISYKVERKD